MGGGGGVAAATTVVESREWYLAAIAPENLPTSDHLKLRTVTVSLDYESIPDEQMALQLLLISVDPYLRSRITGRNDDLYLAQLPINKVITGYGIGRVVRSKNNNFSEGDIVVHPFFPIAEYCITPSDFVRKIDPTADISLPDYLSCLGVPGFTAWVGIKVIGNPDPGSNVFISAAAGGVGMFAGQLAKLKGCRVVGSTGSDEKVQVLKDEFGYDEAFNYHKETDFDAILTKYFPDGIDLYLDNVGGKMLEAVLNHVNKGARIPISGMISQYNTNPAEREGLKNLLNIVGKEVKMEGFLCGSFLNRFGEFSQQMEKYMKEGKIKPKHKIDQGIESFFENFVSLFSSSNVGKVIIQVAS
ncbi:2-alkenal reductase (NADP(+)-dependent)-like [Cynara cardunculus var. scolymus]|uniref:2-alkenal reductase (NADP(+)-dependent)-like n=1 Tax=Cynara cardunculus var. scolymus TaxID=59895 RepID=UPI000D62ACDF|nr:2-alkenal reductase (NADP(+)-dependent)-like [Cynara cardunculus var. scolymus]